MSKPNSKQQATDKSCPNCQTPMMASAISWLQYCNACDLQSSSLDLPTFNGTNPIGWTDDAVDFLEQLRFDNAHSIISEMSKHTELHGKVLMDIGCAVGWFMTICQEYGLRTKGVEPDKKIAEVGLKRGFDIKIALFPDERLEQEQADIVSFNDVFEHIPNPIEALQASHRLLDDNGLLMINLPNSNGVFYRIARVAAKFGYTAPLERLWQKGYLSPHLYYFNHTNLQQLCEQHGFVSVSQKRLPSIQVDGLWNRIRHNDAHSLPMSFVIFTTILIASPFIRAIFPSDIIFHLYRKTNANSESA